jgi:hypothetical protein
MRCEGLCVRTARLLILKQFREADLKNNQQTNIVIACKVVMPQLLVN